jgi:hypothetical protein
MTDCLRFAARPAAIALALFAISAVGCAEPTTGQITGTVTVDGQPAKEGAISFFPVSGRGKVSGGAIVDGKYSVEAALGEVKVEIRIPKVVGERKVYDTPDSPVMKTTEESLPARYHDESELRYTVEAGEHQKDYELTSK